MKEIRIQQIILIQLCCLILSGQTVDAQYFGRNKVGYKDFDFDVYQTPHFEIYHYLDNDSLLNDLAVSAEEWYARHQKMFRDTFQRKNPIILYNNQADFQQTNAVSGLIGTGTGGVTESLKNRVVMPVAYTHTQTDHVLGHELVHAFQYKTLTKPDSTAGSFKNLPLWMVEGMAEYLSLGSIDPNTAMWMRDALLNNDFPTLKQLSRDSKYFPYRYGQAFWATIGKTWGDSIVVPLFRETARIGYDKALTNLLGVNAETFSGMWKNAMQVRFNDYLKDSLDRLTGTEILSGENSGRINVSPSMSPDGRYLAFYSEKDLFTLDLYLYDITEGKIVRKLASTLKNDEIDDLNFIESAGSWSPDGKRFAFVIFSQGMNKLAILDIEKNKITDEIEIDHLPSFINPAWSPDGQSIVVSGLREGSDDLYLYELKTGKIRKLTDDYGADIHPSWSSDGRKIVFAKERVNHEQNRKKFSFDIAVYDLETENVTTLDAFPGADNLNPVFSSDNGSVFFLSDKDGFRNIFRIDLSSGKVYRLTDYMTGVSGITAYSPAISMAPGSDRLSYTYYWKNGYRIYVAGTSEFNETEVDPHDVNLEACTLPPLNHVSSNIVDTSLYNRPPVFNTSSDTFREVPYRPKFKLDYISNVQAGVSAGRYGTGLAGSVNMMFSDIIGNNQLFAALAANGEVFDFGGQVAYIQTKNKINWGASVSHIPYRTGYSGYQRDTLTIKSEKYPVNNYMTDLVRMFQDQISVFSYYPISRTRRLEAGASASLYYYRIDRYNNYFADNGILIGASKEKRPSPRGFNLQQVDLAYVEDNSYFGTTSPMQGHRSRLQIAKNFGALGFYSAVMDYRKYFFIKPVNLSFRLYHYGRYGREAESNLISPLFIGYPWLVRGYDNSSFYNASSADRKTLNIDQLTGSRMLVGNAEFRVPMTGPRSLSLIQSKYLYTDLNFFFDGGLAWNSDQPPSLKWQTDSPTEKIPVFSTGTSLRINVLGYLVIEPFYAIPLQNGGWNHGVFGVNFTPGW